MAESCAIRPLGGKVLYYKIRADKRVTKGALNSGMLK
jgi:hypothetical protein